MARLLAIKNVQKELGIANLDGQPVEDTLNPGCIRLYNYYQPALSAGLYSVEAVQTVQSKDNQQITIVNKPTLDSPPVPIAQRFSVISPQFSLDPALINSHYPPDGAQETGNILPHVVFSDPHVPWARQAGHSHWAANEDRGYNRVPWFALMVFKADDLKVSKDEATALALNTIKGNSGASVYDDTKLPTNGAYGMTVAEYLGTIKSRVRYEVADDFDILKTSQEGTSVIFPRKSQVLAILGPAIVNDEPFPGLQQQKLLSHVRLLNVEGIPDAGLSGHGYYGVTVSSQTGDLTAKAPTSHIVHLISIEHLDATLSAPADETRIGLVSLYSWTYNCIPTAITWQELMANLGAQSQSLRPPKEALNDLQSQATLDTPASKGAQKLFDRLNLGYTIARWRAPSGEESVAFNRGPLAPLSTLDVPSGSATSTNTSWPALSMTGRDYLIFDKTTGILDATYSAAWSLGKLMAISDSNFNAALLRFRSFIWNISASRTRAQANGMRAVTSILGDSNQGVSDGRSLASGDFSGTPFRLVKPTDVPLAPLVTDPSMAGKLADHIERTVLQSASTAQRTVRGITSSSETLFNGFVNDSPINSDWDIIYNWLYDALFLSQIPTHVLFHEPSHLKSFISDPVPPNSTKLQPEALRFFYIDHAWLDAFIDGALSCANHVEPQTDTIRLKLKKAFNLVMKQPIENSGRLPPVPRYGFVIRSAIVRVTPDMILTVRRWKSTPDSANPGKFVWSVDEGSNPVVRHTKLDDYTIMSLLECPPEEVAYIQWAQPSHQQRFSFTVNPVGDSNTGSVTYEPKLNIIRLFTDPNKAPPNREDGQPSGNPDLEWKALPAQYQFSRADQLKFYNSSTRCINAELICSGMASQLKNWGSARKVFLDSGFGSSSIFGIEMNDRAYHYKIAGTPPSSDKRTFPLFVRQLWTGPQSGSTAISALSSLQADKAVPAAAAPQSTHSTTLMKFDAPPASNVSLPKGLNYNQLFATTLTKSLIPATKPAPKQTLGTDTSQSGAGVHFQPIPYGESLLPQFEVLVHPDYKPPPPRPEPNTALPGTYIYSTIDWTPTQNDYLFDLVISIRRRRPKEKTNLTLKSLFIEIPISRGNVELDKQDLDGRGHLPREPLIAAGENNFGSTRIAANQRFLAVPFNSPASSIDDGRWDGWPVLLIQLTPRSGKLDGEILLTDDAKTSAIAVRVSNVVIAPNVTPVTIDALKRGKDLGTTVGVKVPNCGVVPVRLTEKYSDDGKNNQWSYAEVIKRDIKDPSWNGL